MCPWADVQIAVNGCTQHPWRRIAKDEALPRPFADEDSADPRINLEE
jgi:hypothetical protein